jgi:ribonuclease VapC
MVIDSSALVAIALREPERERFSAAILSCSAPVISAANWFEAAIVAERKLLGDGRGRFDRLMQVLRIRIEPVTHEHALIARSAYRSFGLYSPTKALNYGDCFAYALAKQLGMPLLFKGNDFPKTDIRSALA